MAKRKRVLSGMRPTGPLHIGHYFGALANWVKMQEEYDCFYFVADWHALTTDYADTSQVRHNTREIATDWLASGLDPAKCTMFVQSQNLEHAELHLLLSMITPLSWLERVPTYKEQLDQIKDKDLHTYGFLGYPVLQAADIVIYDADFVPVGEDQVPQVELTREIAKKFNFHTGISVDAAALHKDENSESARKLNLLIQLRRHGRGASVVSVVGTRPASNIESEVKAWAAEIGLDNFKKQIEATPVLGRFVRFTRVLSEPQVMLTETPRIPGTDGRKMSKSYNNTIWLSEDDDSIRQKIRGMMTDPQRVHRNDPGRPEVCPVFGWHKLFSQSDVIARVDRECRTAEIGCVDCKALMADALIRWIGPIRARRKEYEAHPERVDKILAEGSARARRVTKKTMRRVREAIFGSEEIGRPKRARAAARQAAQGS